MCRHAWPRSAEIIYDFIKKKIDISPRSARSLIKLWSRFGRDRLPVDTPGHTSTQFPVPRRPLLWPGVFRKLASPYSTTQNGSSRANRLVGCVGAISPLLGPPRPFCCQRPISPISQFALDGLVHTIGTLNPIHMQPPVQNKAIVRPLKRRDPTVLPSKTQTHMSKISRRFHMSKAPGGAPRAGQVQQRHIGNCIRQ